MLAIRTLTTTLIGKQVALLTGKLKIQLDTAPGQKFLCPPPYMMGLASGRSLAGYTVSLVVRSFNISTRTLSVIQD